jgi:hypothetical protein
LDGGVIHFAIAGVRVAEGGAMFAVHCPTHKSRVLIWTSLVEAVRNVAGGIEVDYRCTCGHRGTWRTGRKANAPVREPARLGIAAQSGAEYGVMRPMVAQALAGGAA